MMSFVRPLRTKTNKRIPGSLFTPLSRASIFISGFNLSAAEVKSVLDNTIFCSANVDEPGLKGFADGRLSLEGWKELLAYSQLRDSLPKGVHATLLDLLRWVLAVNTAVNVAKSEGIIGDAGEAAVNKSRVKRIVGLMPIKEETVKSLLERFDPPGANHPS